MKSTLFLRSMAAGVLLLIPASAFADLIISFQPGGDGGVVMDVTGSGTYLDGGVESDLFLANVGDFLDFNLGGNDLFADSFAGTWLSNGSPVNVLNILVDKDLPNVGGDDIRIAHGDGNLGPGTYNFNLTATWLVTTLPYTRMIPGGSYGPGTTGDSDDFDSISITVAPASTVPEPGSAALLLAGVVVVAGRRLTKRRSNRQLANA